MFRHALRLVSKVGAPLALEEVAPCISIARSTTQIPFDVQTRNFRYASDSRFFLLEAGHDRVG